MATTPRRKRPVLYNAWRRCECKHIAGHHNGNGCRLNSCACRIFVPRPQKRSER